MMTGVKTFSFPENCISVTFFFCEKMKELVLKVNWVTFVRIQVLSILSFTFFMKHGFIGFLSFNILSWS